MATTTPAANSAGPSTAQGQDKEDAEKATYEALCHCGQIRFTVTLSSPLYYADDDSNGVKGSAWTTGAGPPEGPPADAAQAPQDPEATAPTGTAEEKEKQHTILNCNCSICTRLGYLLVYPPRSAVHFISPVSSSPSNPIPTDSPLISRYKFHANAIKDHLFCSHCGTSLMIEFNGFRRPRWIERHPGEAPELQQNRDQWDRMGISVRTFKNLNLAKCKFQWDDGISDTGLPYDTAGEWGRIVEDAKKKKEHGDGDGDEHEAKVWHDSHGPKPTE